MIAFAYMLLPMAEAAGIKTPFNLAQYDANDYPHWYVYQKMQVGAAMPSPAAHWTNAMMVAAIPDDKIKTITPEELVMGGFALGFAQP